jgi:hypothetical protein
MRWLSLFALIVQAHGSITMSGAALLNPNMTGYSTAVFVCSDSGSFDGSVVENLAADVSFAAGTNIGDYTVLGTGSVGPAGPVLSVAMTGFTYNLGGSVATGNEIGVLVFDNSLVQTVGGDAYDIYTGGWLVPSDGANASLTGHGPYQGAPTLTSSTICIAEGTLIETDGGEVRIEDLTPSHKIGGQYVRDMTKQYLVTTAEAQKMVQISKDALGPGVPNKDTFLTDYHMVYHPKYNYGKGVQASQMVDGATIKYVPYEGHVYNILFDKYRHVRGQNIELGTLPPAHRERWESSLVFGPKRRTRYVNQKVA